MQEDLPKSMISIIKIPFAPTLKMVPMRLMFSITTGLNLEFHHIDIKTALLHGDLDEETYMEQPPYFVSSTIPYYVCKLHISLYGLKQSSRMWHQKLHTNLEAIGFRCLQVELRGKHQSCYHWYNICR